MRKLLILIYLNSLFYISSYGQFSGLRFAGHEELPELRTGLDLSPDRSLVIRNSLELSFDIFFQPKQEANFGYIFRALLGKQNIDLLINLDDEGGNNFKLVIGKQTSNISFSIDPKILISDWTNFRFIFNPEKHKVFCYINEKVYVDSLSKWQWDKELKLNFGANSSLHYSTTDVLNMTIRNIKITDDDKLVHYWPLDQREGNVAKETEKMNDGVVTNPHWLLNLNYYWNNVANLTVSNRAYFTYDEENERIFIISDDSLYISDKDFKKFNGIAYSDSFNTYPSVSFLYDTIRNELISYSIDEGFKSHFDFGKRKWIKNPSKNITVYWHHNRIILPNGQLYVFGGYGMHTYKKSTFRYNDEWNKWDTIKWKGVFTPRYLAGGVYRHSDSLYYIIGGYGSESGEQIANPDYYYDLYTYSFKDNTFIKKTDFKNLTSEFLFANSLYFDEEKNSMYGLLYPKFVYKNELQLVKISLDKNEIIKTASKIPYNFLDIKSYADLYYSSSSKKLITVISCYDDKTTKISVYTISYPPQEQSLKQTNHDFAKNVNLYISVIVFGTIIFIVIIVYVVIRKIRKYIIKREEVIILSKFRSKYKDDLNVLKQNSIVLFGGFQVIDKYGADITNHFTPLLKKLFLFIMLNSLRNNKGVSTEKLNETFWFDKSADSAMNNNRRVNITKLKALIETVGNSTISKTTGYWKFEFDPNHVYIDYFEYLQLISERKALSKEQIIQLLNIAERGSFLLNTNDDWLDTFKSEVSNDIVDSLLSYIDLNEDDPDFIIHLTNCVFYFDAVSEEAMQKKCNTLVKMGKHSLAQQSFMSFVKEYETLYAEKYTKSFKDVISN